MVLSIHHNRYSKLRAVLKNERKKAGLTQVQIAKLLNMEQSNLSKIERGERYIDVLLFIDYCLACKANPVDVMRKLEESDS
jgi:transcriptional regulator with XRE-family HTH domain